MTTLRTTLALAAGALLVCAAPVQAGPADAQAKGRVKPLTVETQLEGSYAQADVDALARKLSQAYEIVRATPIMREPRGFSIEPKVTVKSGDRSGKQPLTAGLTVATRPVHVDWSSTEYDPASGTYFTPHPFMSLSISANNPRGLFGNAFDHDDQGAYFAAPRLVDQGGGAFVGTNGATDYWIYSPSGRLPFRPITVERYLKKQIAEAEAAMDDAADAGDFGSPADSGMPSKAEMMAQIDQMERELRAAGLDDAQVAEMVAAARAGIEGYQEPQYDPSADPELRNLADQAMSNSIDHLQALEGELASLTPAQRKAPACQWLGDPSRMPASGLDVQCRDPRGMLVEEDPTFFDPRQPKSAIQLLVVYYDGKPSGDPNFSYLDVAAAAAKELDYGRLRALTP